MTPDERELAHRILHAVTRLIERDDDTLDLQWFAAGGASDDAEDDALANLADVNMMAHDAIALLDSGCHDAATTVDYARAYNMIGGRIKELAEVWRERYADSSGPECVVFAQIMLDITSAVIDLAPPHIPDAGEA